MNKPVRPVLLILATILLLSSSAVLFAAETSLERPVFKSGKATLTFAWRALFGT